MSAVARTEVAVVGGGIAGCSTALELARRGIRVTLLERHSIASGASGRNNGGLMNTTDPDAARVMAVAQSIYTELDEGPVKFDLRKRDNLQVARDDAQLAFARARAAGLRAVGRQVDELSAGWFAAHLPRLELQTVGGFLLHDAWSMSPGRATHAFAEAARRHGATVRVGERVAAVEVHGGRVSGLVTDSGRLAVDAVVAANGPWVSELAPEVPIGGARGWLLRTAPLGWTLPYGIQEASWPDLDELGRVALPPTLREVASGEYDRPGAASVLLGPLLDGGILIGASMAPTLMAAVEGIEMPKWLAEHALAFAPGLRDVRIRAAWSGIRPMTPDGAPAVGLTATEGVWVIGGHGSIGMMLGPVSARWLVDAMTGGPPEPRMAALDPLRFAAAKA